ncbi:MAG: DEAD/DEAH box helicase [Sporolactobacillus sp.]
MMLFAHKLTENESYDPEMQRFLYGKEYRIDELPFAKEVIQEHLANDYLELRPGIEPLDEGFLRRLLRQRKWRCNRCGNTDPRDFAVCRCHDCGSPCVYCRHCLNMGGAIRSCTQLVTWAGPEPVPAIPQWGLSGKLCAWKGELSPQQKVAAAKLNDALAEGRSFLIWAVTGSGKTELLFPALENALLRGKRVAIATPRTDVVKELAPRLHAAFPAVPISALYAGTEERLPEAPLVITTTHQLIRYQRYFDLIFIDEVDAFPFHYDSMLNFAVHKAAKRSAPFAYLTATPPDDLRRDYQNQELDGIKIARRYHGQPLPIPSFRWIGNWSQSVRKGFLPHVFEKWIREKITAGSPLFIFVPSVTMVRNLTELLQRTGLGQVAGVHADDPDRHAKVAYFRQGKLNVLITTTILERGVTIPGVEVAVFGADDPIFDERALVQIAGRVGRSADKPDGDILFFHNGRTVQMIKALRHIEQMNEEAGF